MCLGLFFPKKKVEFCNYEYKFIMALGMASIDSVKMQSRIGDRGGLGLITGEDLRRFDKLSWTCLSHVLHH